MTGVIKSASEPILDAEWSHFSKPKHTGRRLARDLYKQAMRAGDLLDLGGRHVVEGAPRLLAACAGASSRRSDELHGDRVRSEGACGDARERQSVASAVGDRRAAQTDKRGRLEH